MANIEFDEIGEELDPSLIDEFEKEINKELPADFKAFLTENNGGYPADDLYTPEFNEVDPNTSAVRKQATDIEQFFSLEEIRFEYQDIVDEDNIPDIYLPFACTSFDNLILICLDKSENYGSVFFSNHDLFDTKNGMFTLSKISDSFSDFIEALYVEE